jgi:DNA-binding response OmpR family regulator
MNMPNVLSVGADDSLLSLRHLVLCQAGFNVFSTVNTGEAMSLMRAAHCGTLLLCYSLSIPVRQELVREFRQWCPDGHVIAITNQRQEIPPIDADTFVYGVEGPEVLIETLRSVA